MAFNRVRIYYERSIFRNRYTFIFSISFISNNTKMVLENKIDKEINLIKDKIRELENMGISKKEIIERIEK